MSKSNRLVGVPLTLAFLIAFIALTKTSPGSWNDISRIATIEALVEQGTWAIDVSAWANLTKDKILLNGKFYSDKMPLLSLLGAGVYAVLHHGLGMTLGLDCSLIGKSAAYYWLTVAFAGVPVTLMLLLFFDLAWRQNVPMWSALIGTSALGIGTMIFPYALVFNHHAPSACFLFASFYILATRAPNKQGWLALAGFLAAMAVSFDGLSGIIAGSVAVAALVRYRAKFSFFALGMLIPLGLTAWLNYQIADTLVPLYMITKGYDYPGTQFLPAVAGNVAAADPVVYAFGMFLGSRGLFMYNPLLLFGLVGAIGVALKRSHPLGLEAVCALSGFILLGFYLVMNTDNYGGLAYGQRWFVPVIPILGSFIFFVPPLNTAIWKNLAWLLFLPAYVFSISSSFQGAQAPWIYWPPPLQAVEKSDPAGFPFLARQGPIERSLELRYGSHLSAVGYTLIPEGTFTGGQTALAIMYWQTDGPISTCYRMHVQLKDQRGHGWAESIREPHEGIFPDRRWIHRKDIIGDMYTLALPPTMPPGIFSLAVSVYDLKTNELLPAFGDGMFIGKEPSVAELRIEKNKSSITATELQKQFHLEQPYFVDMGEIRLIGFKPIAPTLEPGQTLAVGVYWRARSRPVGDYHAWVQLRDATGATIAEQKSRPADGIYPTMEWFAGEVLLDWHDLIIPDHIAAGEYSVWVGLSEDINSRLLGETRIKLVTVAGK